MASAGLRPHRGAAPRLALAGALAALGIALHAAEGMFPALPIPGARLGLSNLATLLALISCGWREALAVAVLRVAATGLAAGAVGGPAFCISAAGCLFSTAVMCVVNTALGGVGRLDGVAVIGVSLAGAAAHNAAQLATARLFCGNGVLAWAPWLLACGAASGWAVGRLAGSVAAAMRGTSAAMRGTSAVPAPLRRRRRPRGPLVRAALAVVAVAAVCLAPALPARGELFLVVEVGGRRAATVSLRPGSSGRLVVPLRRGARAVIQVEGLRARLLRLPDDICPQHICSSAGWIDAPGETLVCLPNRLVARIERRDAASSTASRVTRAASAGSRCASD